MLGRVEAAGYTENDVDIQTVSELVDDIRDAVTDYQVSGDPKQFLWALSFRQTGPDGAPTDHIRPESQINCESEVCVRANPPDSSTG